MVFADDQGVDEDGGLHRSVLVTAANDGCGTGLISGDLAGATTRDASNIQVEVLGVFREVVINDADGDTLVHLSCSKGGGAGAGNIVAARQGGAITGFPVDGNGSSGGLVQHQVETGSTGLFINDDIAHGQGGLLGGVKYAVAVEVKHLVVIVYDGGKDLGAADVGIDRRVQLQCKRLHGFGSQVVFQADAHRLRSFAGGEGQRRV